MDWLDVQKNGDIANLATLTLHAHEQVETGSVATHTYTLGEEGE